MNPTWSRLKQSVLFHHRSPQPNADLLTGYSLNFWILVIVTGAGAGLCGAGLMKLLAFVEHVTWSYQGTDFFGAIERTSAVRRVLALAVAGIIAGVGVALARRLPDRQTGGLVGAIWFRSGQLPWLQTFINAILSIVIVGIGASLGREGALKQTGAAIGSRLARWADLSSSQHRLLAACGAGAGMAAAYNVPFGGALFAAEVLLGSVSIPFALPAIAASAVATVISWTLLPNAPSYDLPVYQLSLSQIAWAVIAGPLFGLASVVFVRAIAWAEARKPKGSFTVAAPILLFTALGFLSIFFPQLLGNGKDLAQLVFTNQIGIQLICWLAVLKLVATAGCVSSGAPGGLFTPSMCFGALLGALLGQVWSIGFPGATPGSYAIIGAGAVVAASTHGPLSGIVILLELTNHGDALLVPVLIAVAGSTLVAGVIDTRSVYSARFMELNPAD